MSINHYPYVNDSHRYCVSEINVGKQYLLTGSGKNRCLCLHSDYTTSKSN